MSSLTLNDLQTSLLSCRWQSWEWPWEQSAVFCELSLPCCPSTSLVYWRHEAAWSVDLLPEDKEDATQELSAKTLSFCSMCTTVTVRQLLAITFMSSGSLQQCWKHKLYEEKKNQASKKQNKSKQKNTYIHKSKYEKNICKTESKLKHDAIESCKVVIKWIRCECQG